MIRITLAFAASCLLGACAGAPSTPEYVLDSAKMQQVERAALTHGVDVHWVNPPYRLATASGG